MQKWISLVLFVLLVLPACNMQKYEPPAATPYATVEMRAPTFSVRGVVEVIADRPYCKITFSEQAEYAYFENNVRVAEGRGYDSMRLKRESDIFLFVVFSGGPTMLYRVAENCRLVLIE